MPKMKTRKAVSGKFKITGTGMLKRSKCGRRKLMSPKAPKRKRQLRKRTVLTQGLLKTYKRLMCCE